VKRFRKIWQGSPSPAHYLFAFVLLVRLISLTRLAVSPFLFPSGGDMHFYNEWAQQILHGRLTNHLAFYGSPLYAYWLAFLYKVFGYGPFVPGFLQACFDAGTATLLYKLSLRIFGSVEVAERISPDNQAWNFLHQNRPAVIGWLSAAAWTFFVPAQAYAIILMPTAATVFVFWFLIWQIVKRAEAPSPLRCLSYGVVIGVTAMAVPTIFFVIPLLLGALFSRAPLEKEKRSRWRERLTAAALLFLGIGLGTSPAWVHNYFVARDPVFLSAHGGINFWIGNNPEATGYPHFPGLRAGQASMLEDSINLAQAAAGRPLKRAEVSAYWAAKGRAYVAADFAGWLKLVGRKIFNFWNAFEYDDLSVITKLREAGIVWPGLHFGMVAALAIPGIFLSLATFPALRWVAAAVLMQMLAVIPVFVTERYRIAAAPGLILFAAFGVWTLWANCVMARGKPVALQIVLLALATVFVSWPQRDSTLWALEPYNSGAQALETGDLSKAQEKLDLARAYLPENPEINLALGNLGFARGDYQKARMFYVTTLRANPNHESALSNLGVLELNEHRPAVAEKLFRKAMAQDPRNAKTHYLLAKTLLQSGHFLDASRQVDQALELSPNQVEFQMLKQEILKAGGVDVDRP
jgi:tetratricopeptide (TPR) repeat protein